MQRVHTFIRFAEPLTSARTRWMLGFQRRGERRCECETCMPKLGFRPQTSHTAAIAGAMLPAGPKGGNASARMSP